MKVTIFLLIIFQSILLLFERNINPLVTPPQDYKLIWSDEFNGRHLDRTKWNYHGIGKRRDAFNTPEVIRLDGKGHLVIEAKLKGDSVLSGIIDTGKLFETQYGYFECRASLTKAKGIWPAFWLSSSVNMENGIPETHGAEIDIFEYFIQDKKDFVSHTLHWGGYGAGHKVAGPIWSPLQKTSDDFHTFGLEWTPTSYSTFVDGVKTFTTTDHISKVPEFILLSLEIDEKTAGPLNRKELPDKFVVDYVRVYKKKE